MVANPFIPPILFGRQLELQQMSQILAADGDLLVAGVPGIGRRTLLRWAARSLGARVMEIDCLRATDSSRFLKLLAEGLVATFAEEQAIGLMEQWSAHQPVIVERSPTGRAYLTWPGPSKNEWGILQSLLALPQVMAEWLDCRVVLVFQNFPHLRSWDRSGQWEQYLRQEVQQQSRVSYALIATVPESWVEQSKLQVMTLAPLPDEILATWLSPALAAAGLSLDREGESLGLFLSYVQGHFSDALALARRLWLDAGRQSGQTTPFEVLPHHVHRSALALVEDLSVTFESLILLLPPSQVRVLESLALDPTDSPHAREYIRKHNLSRGGGLQGALASLEQKGLVYGSEQNYRIALPMLAFWLKHRLT